VTRLNGRTRPDANSRVCRLSRSVLGREQLSEERWPWQSSSCQPRLDGRYALHGAVYCTFSVGPSPSPFEKRYGVTPCRWRFNTPLTARISVTPGRRWASSNNQGQKMAACNLSGRSFSTRSCSSSHSSSTNRAPRPWLPPLVSATIPSSGVVPLPCYHGHCYPDFG
jgi:hypothetical protein